MELLKWIGAVLMLLDHTNKALWHGTVPGLYEAGRLALPIFAITFGINLARPGALRPDRFRRLLARLLLAGAAATPAFLLIGGGWSWWPLNVMFTFAVAASVARAVEAGRIVCGVATFVLGGAVVEFWWPGVGLALAAWAVTRTGTTRHISLALVSVASLRVINGNWFALMAVPFLLLLRIDWRLPRVGRWMYVFYPAHLTGLAVLRKRPANPS